jgi:hypothetical protein
MLENLIGDHNVELPVESLRTNIEFRKLRRGVGAKFEGALPLRAARDLQDMQGAGVLSGQKFEATAVHNDPNPVGGIKPNPFEPGPNTSAKVLVG